MHFIIIDYRASRVANVCLCSTSKKVHHSPNSDAIGCTNLNLPNIDTKKRRSVKNDVFVVKLNCK